jgi:hypothetical protein
MQNPIPSTPWYSLNIGDILAFISILVAIVLYLKSNKKKSLSYCLVSDTPIVSVKKKGISEDIKILYKDKVVHDVRVIILKVWNSGEIPIEKTDFEQPLNFIYLRKTNEKGIPTLLDYSIDTTEPNNLFMGKEYFIDKKVALVPVLMNKGDSITIKFLFSNLEGKLGVQGRVIGISKIQEAKQTNGTKKYTLSELYWIIVFIIFTFTICAFIFFTFHSNIPDLKP